MNNECLVCPNCKQQTGRIFKKYRKGIANCRMYWVECYTCGLAQKHDDLHGYRTMQKAIDHWITDKIDRITNKLGETKIIFNS